MAKISIVIPVLNARPRISETLESIRQQTYPRDEIETIVVDDGSSEQCVRIARTFLKRHGMQGTVLVTGGNYGSSASLNRGWQAASGDWIQFLDGDDLLAPSKLDVQIRQLAQLPDVICSSWQRLGPHGDGWPFDADLNSANVFQLLEAIEGVERVEEVLFFEHDLRNHERVGFGKDLVKLSRDSLFLAANHQVVVR